MTYQKELQAALEAARQAGTHILTAYHSFTAIPDARADITTEVDRQSQEIILQHLAGAFPEDALCAEEETPTLEGARRRGERLWVVDPIDGTRGFARKNGEFSVMIALVEGGEIAVGVVLEPALARLTYAARGQGCWRQDGTGEPVRCQVSGRTLGGGAVLTTSHSRPPGKLSPAAQALGVEKVRETYSAGVKLALVARGEADLYVNTYEAFHDWDICAGQILTEEAGGRVTDLRGARPVYCSEGFWQRGGLLASNGEVHAEALARLAPVARTLLGSS